MNKAHTARNKFQRLLEQKQLELAAALKGLDHIWIERSADQIDETQLASERDLAIRNLDADSMLLRQVIAALQRIREGNFGVCTDCEREISLTRLKAVPWAPRCIWCQEAADRNGEPSTDYFSRTLIRAA